MKRIGFVTVTTVFLTGVGAAAAMAMWALPPAVVTLDSKAAVLPTLQRPAASVSGDRVTISWTPADGGPAVRYRVHRYSTGGVRQAMLHDCDAVLAAAACTELGVPAGTWLWTVQVVRGRQWEGPESVASGPVTVGAPEPGSATPGPATPMDLSAPTGPGSGPVAGAGAGALAVHAGAAGLRAGGAVAPARGAVAPQPSPAGVPGAPVVAQTTQAPPPVPPVHQQTEAAPAAAAPAPPADPVPDPVVQPAPDPVPVPS